MSSIPQSTQWLACVTSLPTDEPAARMRVLRMLESLGCAVLREGVYLLPETTQNRQSLERLCEHVSRAGGSATLLAVTAKDGQQAAQFRLLFDRTARYETLIKTVGSLRAGFGISDPAALSQVLAKQRREFESIAMLDFFPNEMKDRAGAEIERATGQVRALMFPQSQTNPAPTSRESYVQRIWATRVPLWADRLASAWLIRRLIDKEGTLSWLEKGDTHAATAVSFGFEGASFYNSGTEVTFERLLQSFSLDKLPPLKRMAALVHHIEAGGPRVAEAAGVESLLQGARRRSTTPEELFRECEKTFDLLYDAYCEND